MTDPDLTSRATVHVPLDDALRTDLEQVRAIMRKDPVARNVAGRRKWWQAAVRYAIGRLLEAEGG